MNISPLAVVDPEAQLGENITIEPFAIVKKDVVIGEMKKLPKEYDTTTLTEPDSIEALSKQTTDSIIRAVLYDLYKKAP